MSLEKQVADSFARRADDVQTRPGARATFERHVERAYRRRTVASGVLSVAILTTIGLAAASLPSRMRETPSLFADTSNVSSFRYETTTNTIAGSNKTIGVIKGEVDLVNEKSRTVITGDGFPIGLTMIAAGNKIYMQLPMPIGGKHWIGAPNEPFVQSFQSIPLTGNDPTAFLDELNHYAFSIEEKGDARVRGVSTTKYRAVVDGKRLFAPIIDAMEQQMRRVMASFPNNADSPGGSFQRPSDAEIDEQMEMMRNAYPDRLDVELWIGHDQLVRRMQMAFSSAFQDNEPARVELTTDYFDYGARIEIAVPPAEDVKEVESLVDTFLPAFMSGSSGSSTSSCMASVPEGGQPQSPQPCE